jgi:hypothetical protein
MFLVGWRFGECRDDAERRDRFSGRRVAHFWPASKTSGQRNPVQTLQWPLAHCLFRLDIRANNHVPQDVVVQFDGSL